MPDKEITPEIREELNKLIELFGSLQNATALLGIEKITIEKYLNGSSKVISNKIWEEILSKLLFKEKDTLFNNLAKLIKELRKELKYKEKYRWESLYNEIEVKRLKEKNKEIIESLEENPFSILLITSKPYFFEIKSIEEIITVIKKTQEDENTSKYDLYAEMIKFSQLYTSFRPHRITKGDVYFGTVEALDRAYNELFSYLQIKPTIRFSKSFQSFAEIYLEHPKKEHKDIHWDYIIQDISDALEAVKITMRYEAFKMILSCGNNLPHLMRELALEYIRNYYRENIASIEYDNESDDTFIINGEKIKITKPYQLDDFFRKKKET